jgi:FkbM family methyltransferase
MLVTKAGVTGSVRLGRWRAAVTALGPVAVLSFLLRRAAEALRLHRHPYRMEPTDAVFPVWCRPQSSDLDVFSQIFIHREYRCLDDTTDVGVVIDCGANVGYSAAYFLSRFPSCMVIAVEPDQSNFAALERNLSPYGRRCRAIRSGVWSENVGLVMHESPFRDGREWARRVRPALAGETVEMEAVDIQTLIDSCDTERISILKIDIEGAELEVFSSAGWRGWIDRVDTVVIEVHGEEAHKATTSAFEAAGFETQWCDELIMASRPPGLDR